MKKIFFSFSIVTIVSIMACTLFPYTHKLPESIHIDNEKFINKPIDKVWNSIANIFFQDTFKLVSSDKVNGTIIAIFKTDRPINYVDCGIVTRKYRDEDKVVHEYNYNYADSTAYKYEKDGQPYDVKVKVNLTAEITVNIIKLGAGTKVSINTRYTLNRNILPTNSQDNSPLPTEVEKIQFTTSVPFKNSEYSCVANGNIENNLLNSIN